MFRVDTRRCWWSWYEVKECEGPSIGRTPVLNARPRIRCAVISTRPAISGRDTRGRTYIRPHQISSIHAAPGKSLVGLDWTRVRGVDRWRWGGDGAGGRPKTVYLVGSRLLAIRNWLALLTRFLHRHRVVCSDCMGEHSRQARDASEACKHEDLAREGRSRRGDGRGRRLSKSTADLVTGHLPRTIVFPLLSPPSRGCTGSLCCQLSCPKLRPCPSLRYP